MTADVWFLADLNALIDTAHILLQCDGCGDFASIDRMYCVDEAIVCSSCLLTRKISKSHGGLE
ncbi:hypothetical protein [Methanothrix sp.]|uniref:hypothetical protein n=1 Tax=Methanothrix sp. TaxID=90426 RepID=UPI0034E1B359